MDSRGDPAVEDIDRFADAHERVIDAAEQARHAVAQRDPEERVAALFDEVSSILEGRAPEARGRALVPSSTEHG